MTLKAASAFRGGWLEDRRGHWQITHNAPWERLCLRKFTSEMSHRTVSTKCRHETPGVLKQRWLVCPVDGIEGYCPAQAAVLGSGKWSQRCILRRSHDMAGRDYRDYSWLKEKGQEVESLQELPKAGGSQHHPVSPWQGNPEGFFKMTLGIRQWRIAFWIFFFTLFFFLIKSFIKWKVISHSGLTLSKNRLVKMPLPSIQQWWKTNFKKQGCFCICSWKYWKCNYYIVE